MTSPNFTFTIGSDNVELNSFPVLCNAIHRGQEVKLISNGIAAAACYVRHQSAADTRPSRYVIYGSTGVHTLDYDATDAERLLSHLNGFVQNSSHPFPRRD